MSDTLFSIIEALSEKELKLIPDSLIIGKTKNVEAILFRLLTGSANILYTPTGKIIKQKNLYLDLSALPYKKSYKGVITTLFNNIDISTIGEYFDSIDGANYSFFSELLHEFSFYFYSVSKERKNQTEGFLHLYRILESISYVFPIIWASKSKSGYYGTFHKLREFFSNPQKGEINALKIFLNGFLSDSELEIPFDIDISSVNLKWLNSYICSIKQCIDDKDIIDLDTPVNSFTDKYYARFQIKSNSIINLLVNIRNKYFHFLSGNANNFKSKDIMSPEEFFSSINKPIITWLSYIYYKVLIFRV